MSIEQQHVNGRGAAAAAEYCRPKVNIHTLLSSPITRYGITTLQCPSYFITQHVPATSLTPTSSQDCSTG